jgi:hypothetical protein
MQGARASHLGRDAQQPWGPAQTTPLTSARAPGHWPGPPPLEGPGALAGAPPGAAPAQVCASCLACPCKHRRCLGAPRRSAAGRWPSLPVARLPAQGNGEAHAPNPRLCGKRDPPPSLLLSAENPHYGFGDLGGPMRPRKPGFGTCPAPSLGTPQGRIGSQPVRTHMPRTRAGVYACALRVLALETLRACGRAGATANDVRIAAVGSKPFVETWQLRPSPAVFQRCAGCTQPAGCSPKKAQVRARPNGLRVAPHVVLEQQCLARHRPCRHSAHCGCAERSARRLRQLVQAGVCAADRSAFVATTHR